LTQRTFRPLNANLTHGMAIPPVSDAAEPLTLGQWKIGPAWSTMKVPLVIAALKLEDSFLIDGDMLRQSPNRTTPQRNRSGPSWATPTAAAKVESVLRQSEIKQQSSRRGFGPD
jgi:hypothetical protein